jgi:Transposase DNA-binding
MLDRKFQILSDDRLVTRGNNILNSLFSKCSQSIKQLTTTDAEAKGFYRFLGNENISEEDILTNMRLNCVESCRGKYVLCIQDSSEINLSNHKNRIKHDSFIGTTNANSDKGLGFFIHPSLVLDIETGVPYGYADVKIWNRPLEFKSKFERKYHSLPIEEKESFKWIEVSKNTKEVLSEEVKGIVIVQDREGDIYEQFALIPDEKTDLVIRARTDRTLKDNTKLFSYLDKEKSKGNYEIVLPTCLKTNRKKRVAKMDVKYKEVEIVRTNGANKSLQPTVKLYLIEAKEKGYKGEDKLCWRILTTIPIESIEMAITCLIWYGWRWRIEEVFKILKQEGYNIEASELGSAKAVRKMTLMIMEVAIKLFLMRIAYDEPELEIEASTCFNKEEIKCLELQISKLEGKTEKQKNPFVKTDLKRYVWCIARLGGWKGYEKARKPGITTLWIGIKKFKMIMEGWSMRKNVSTR